MIVKNLMFKLGVLAVVIISLVFLYISYLYLEKMLTEREIVITVINKEKFGNSNKYLIFTPEEVFENSDSFFQRKSNSDIIFRKLERGISYRVKVVGIYIPSLHHFRNITEVIGPEVKEISEY